MSSDGSQMDPSEPELTQVVCPECEVPAQRRELWPHLTHEHGWAADQIRAAIGSHPYAAGPRHRASSD
jgi:hypothetical protein